MSNQLYDALTLTTAKLAPGGTINSDEFNNKTKYNQSVVENFRVPDQYKQHITQTAARQKLYSADIIDLHELRLQDLEDGYMSLEAYQHILKMLYPIGSVLMRNDNINPASFIPGTTWERIPDGYSLATSNNLQTHNMNQVVSNVPESYANEDHLEETYGTKLTIQDLPAHTHKFITDTGGDHTHSTYHVFGYSGSTTTTTMHPKAGCDTNEITTPLRITDHCDEELHVHSGVTQLNESSNNEPIHRHYYRVNKVFISTWVRTQ